MCFFLNTMIREHRELFEKLQSPERAPAPTFFIQHMEYQPLSLEGDMLERVRKAIEIARMREGGVL